MTPSRPPITFADTAPARPPWHCRSGSRRGRPAWHEGKLPRRFQAASPPLISKLACLYASLAGGLLLFGLAELTLAHMLTLQALVLGVFGVLFWLTLPMMQTARDTCCEAHPVMPWIYTGRRDEGAWIEFDRQKRDSTLRAVSARMHANIGKLPGRKPRTMEWVSSSVSSIRSQQTDIENITRAFEELTQSAQRVNEMTCRTQQANADARKSAHQCQSRKAAKAPIRNQNNWATMWTRHSC